MSEDDFVQIQIRCPKCTQRFRVGPELKGRMVECGACEYRFRVDDESLVKNRKFYPGEKKDPALLQYSRQPHPEFVAPARLLAAQYAEAPDLDRVEPTSFGRVIVGIVGGAMMAFTLLILITGGSQNGFLDGVTMDRRLIIAAFAAVVGGVMIIYANPRARIKATIFALLGVAALISTPFYFKQGARKLVGSASNVDSVPPPIVENQGGSAAVLKVQVGYEPMNKALMEVGKEGRVVGIWLKELLGSNAELVENYLMRVSGASDSSHLYPRLNENYLLVLINPKLSLEEMAVECGRLGRVDQIVSDLYLIDATVQNSLFVEQPIAKLSDKTDGAYYQLNLRELQGIDSRRANEALLRLSLAEPIQSRNDIIKRMKELLAMCDREMLENLARALLVWSDGQDGAPEAMMEVAVPLYQKENDLPVEVVIFLSKWQQPGIYPIMEKLWLSDAIKWEDALSKAGPKVEAWIIPYLVTGDNQQRISATRIAARVGGDDALSALQQALKGTDNIELQTSYQNAIDAIKQGHP